MVLSPTAVIPNLPTVLYHKSAKAEDILDKQAAQVRKAKRQRLVWMPAAIKGDIIENIIQGKVDDNRKGPKQGHWSKRPNPSGRAKQYTRFWVEGQHNYMRQRNPKHPDEPIIGSRVQNMNIKMKALKDARGHHLSRWEEGATVLSYGMLKPAYVTTHDDIFLEAVSKTKEVLASKAPPVKGVNCGGSKSGGSESMEDSKK